MRPLRIAVLIGLVSGVAGCVLPPALSIASLVADGISAAGSGKTVTDHAISLLAHEDCRMWRLLQGKSICQADTTVVATAKLPPPLPMHAASPALHAPNPNPAVAGFIVDEPGAGIAIPFPAPKASIPNDVPAPVARPARAAPPPRLSAAPPSPPGPLQTATASFVLDEPDAAIPVSLTAPPKTAAAPKGASAGDTRKPLAQTKPVPQQASVPTQAAPAPATAAAAAVPLRSGVRGEMIIRSGTDEAEARSLADSLHAAGAFVRPVRHGDLTIYEVVMGLSG
jgi:hypothetical protein